MNTLDHKIHETIESIQKIGLNGDINSFVDLHTFTLTHLEELKDLALFQLSGSLYSVLAFERLPGLTRFPNMAYYCLTRGTTAIQPIGEYNLIQENWKYSYAERAKLILQGGIKLISDRISMIKNMPLQQALDISILGDIVKLKTLSFYTNEAWWHRAEEDFISIRNKYIKFSDNEIIFMANNIHNQIADQVYFDLKTYAKTIGLV